MPLRRHGVDEELERIGAILKTMQQKHWPRIDGSPLQDAMSQAPQLQMLLARRTSRPIRLAHCPGPGADAPRNKRYAGLSVSSTQG